MKPQVKAAGGWRGGVGPGRAGAPTPTPIHNLVANPRAAVEVGKKEVDVSARIATGDERTRLWNTQKDRYPGFADYENKTTREIPVVILEPVS